MRWIDIILPEPETNQQLHDHVAMARKALPRVAESQQKDGLDAVTVVHRMMEVGQALFKGIQAVDPEAFSPERCRGGSEVPTLGNQIHDALLGYHIVVDPVWLDLPWSWLHNGVGFLLAKHPLCASSRTSAVPRGHTGRPWMQRLIRSEFLVGDAGRPSLQATLSQLRTSGSPPEMLFIPGHSDEVIRRLIFREAEIIGGALAGGPLGSPLALLEVPEGAVTPSELCEKGLAYQAIHFAGPTSMDVLDADAGGEYWLDMLIEDAGSIPESQLEDAIGIEGEVLGVDPITSLLDDINVRFESNSNSLAAVGAGSSQEGEAGRQHGGNIQDTPGRRSVSGPGSWMLDDGPVDPERFAQGGGMPPLVFSNSYLALPALGRRFYSAGASTFIGPVAPLFSRPARKFAGHCYAALADGWCTGAALWHASRTCRQELGEGHPAWLSYGIQGYGSLALQYL